jgi:hypothetical protein
VDVERPNDSAGHIGSPVVVNRRADDHHVVDNRRRRSHVVLPARIALYLPQANLAVVAEIGAGDASDRIHRDQARIKRGFKEPPFWGGAG